MIPNPRYSEFNENQMQDLEPFEREEKKGRENIEEKHNSSTFLNETLIGLNYDFIRRANTDQNPLKDERVSLNGQENSKERNEKSKFYTESENNFMFEPWNEDSEIFSSQIKTPLTEIRSDKQKSQTIKKSFLITQFSNKFYEHNSSNTYEGTRKSSHTSKDHHRLNNSTIQNLEFKEESDLQEEMKQKNYNYSNEQKVKISLDYIVQKKKHSKMSNLLKMKTQTFDKTHLKHEKINHQSKNLIEALEKLPIDKKLQKSIDRAVDVLKKRNHHSLHSNNSISPKLKFPGSHEIIEQSSKNWLSCRKIDFEKSEVEATNQLKKFSLIKDFELNGHYEIRPENCIAMKQKCKISFKPKRNYLNERKGSKSLTKKFPNKEKFTKEKSQESVKKKFSLGVFLQVNHLTS